jgi:hypothetical protein
MGREGQWEKLLVGAFSVLGVQHGGSLMRMMGGERVDGRTADWIRLLTRDYQGQRLGLGRHNTGTMAHILVYPPSIPPNSLSDLYGVSVQCVKALP